MAARTREYKSDYFRRACEEGTAEGRAKGMAKGQAKAILIVLAARGISISDEARDRITSCADLDQLETWVPLAVTVESVDDLFS